ncbi:MAG: hypothetical protein HZA94_01180 [Candidatus Vogelbacteria bacterium]|nr:hypothetical protein [Candidatus Vogelbacteria bacterium]
MSDNDDSINTLEKRLYSKTAAGTPERRSGFLTKKFEGRREWAEESVPAAKERNVNGLPSLRALLTVSAIFFVVSVLFLVYTFFFSGGANIISPENIDLSVSGPVSVKGGSRLDVLVSITNRNSVPLDTAAIVVTYPPGTKEIGGTGKSLPRYIQELGKMQPNETRTESVNAVIFGEEGSQQDIKVTLQYRTAGSSATFAKVKTFTTLIDSAPVSIKLDLPADTTPDKDTIANIIISSNSTEPLKDILVQAEYPSGFVFRSATPAPTYGNNVWSIGDILANGDREIKVIGQLQGQDGDIKSFRVSAGTRINSDDNKISSIYGSSLRSVTVNKPFIGISMTLNGDSSEEIVVSGRDTIRGDIEWDNNLPLQVINSQMAVLLDGETVDDKSVNSVKGFYNSSSNVITWDKVSGGIPEHIEPGQSGRLSFSFSMLPLIASSRQIYKNPEITLEVKFIGVKFAEGSSQGPVVEGKVLKKIKINSDLQLAAKTLYYAGPFSNTGPLPPVRDRETSYTIVWSVINSSNDVSGAVVRATLPSYVKWLGNISPESEDISYTPLGGQVVWKVGDVAAGSGIVDKPREVAFQVSITPSVSQVSTFPNLTSETVISGEDIFTGRDTGSTKKALTLELTNDPGVTEAEGKRVQ